MDRRELLKTAFFMGGTISLGGGAAAQAFQAAPDEPLTFPPGFLWGSATAAYQVEGAATEDGRGPSIWDTFSKTPGKTKNGDTGDVATDSYHRWREDIALMKQLNLKSCRFSIAWPRIQATGRGPANQKGLDYYSRLTDGLLEAGVRPLPTLYHWDLPQALEDAGGWPNRDTAERFVEYAEIVTRKLGDRITNWGVFNEPKTFTQVGYLYGAHAPGRRDAQAYLRATHTVNLAHGMTIRAMKAIRPGLQIGSAFDVSPMLPASDSAADRAAAMQWDVLLNQYYLVPTLTGRYPDGAVPLDQLATIVGLRPGDEALMKAPLDWVGINHYTAYTVRRGDSGVPGVNAQADWAVTPGKAGRKTDIGWEIYPPGFYQILTHMKRITGSIPIEITENGCADNTAPGADGRVHDTMRQGYYRAYLRELHRAIRDGVPVRGYHAWSLLDNFEWAEGYSQRFGLIYVDYSTQKRTIKDSGRWYAQVAASNKVA